MGLCSIGIWELCGLLVNVCTMDIFGVKLGVLGWIYMKGAILYIKLNQVGTRQAVCCLDSSVTEIGDSAKGT